MSAVVISDSRGMQWTLNSFPVLFGRDDAADIPLTNVLASRRHCEMVRTSDGLVLRDLGSVNGTMVNGAPIEEQVLRFGDQFTIGTRAFRVQRIGESTSSDRSRRSVFGGVTQLLRRLSGDRLPSSSSAAAGAVDSHVEQIS